MIRAWVRHSIKSYPVLSPDTVVSTSPWCAPRPKPFLPHHVQVPRAWAEARMNVAQWNEFASGGHFAALEEPQALLQDIRSFVDKHVVSGAVLHSM